MDESDHREVGYICTYCLNEIYLYYIQTKMGKIVAEKWEVPIKGYSLDIFEAKTDNQPMTSQYFLFLFIVKQINSMQTQLS